MPVQPCMTHLSISTQRVSRLKRHASNRSSNNISIIQKKRRLKQHQSHIIRIFYLPCYFCAVTITLQPMMRSIIYTQDQIQIRAQSWAEPVTSKISMPLGVRASSGPKVSSRQGPMGFAWCIAITRHPWTIISWSACIHNQSSSCLLPSRPFFYPQKQLVWCPRACKSSQSQIDIRSKL